MANYFYNFLQVEGDHNELMRFKENALPKAQLNIHPDEVLVLESLIPVPQKLNSVEFYGSGSLYESFGEDHDNYLTYTFISNWCAPILGFKAISQLYPSLKFILNFESSDENCLGSKVFQNNELLLSEEHSYSTFKHIEIEYKKSCLDNHDIYIDCVAKYFPNLNIKTYHLYDFQKKLIKEPFQCILNIPSINKNGLQYSTHSLKGIVSEENTLLTEIKKNLHNNTVCFYELILPLLTSKILEK